ncbi:MAG: multiheme c-type cytochrome [Planctomycetota bacterium]
MRMQHVLIVLSLGLMISSGTEAQIPGSAAESSGCLSHQCHNGIEPIRDPNSEMMQQIFTQGQRLGDPAGCVVCHGGDPEATTEEDAHKGKAFYADSGSPWINKFTCGQCHAELVKAQWNSLMMTEAGKIQGAAWAFGSLEGYDHRWANYDASNPEQAHERLGTDAYKRYMEQLKIAEPKAFPDTMTSLPEAPIELAKLPDHPEQAVFTYLRTDCQRCHLGVKGRQKRGDYRGMGCSACHIPYGNEGLYEGKDQSIPKNEPGHLLVHMIQGTRKAKAAVHNNVYSGIPVETCTTCHDRGKRIGTSFQGLMESAYASPFTEGGGGQVALHTKHYIALKEDVHYVKGMLCQDCHTSIEMHGDGFLAGTTLAQVEIECADCHGTPQVYPWDLPLGYGDEFGLSLQDRPARGVAQTLSSLLKKGTVYPAEDGYLRAARGNPLGNVVRKGNLVLVHTAAGKNIELKPLKLLRDEEQLKTEAKVAMDNVKPHLNKIECYSCHSTWAPQCYGCHVKVDYSDRKRSFDWVAAGQRHKDSEHLADVGEANYNTFIPGKVQETRSYLRWEAPALAINGEGRVTPVMPGCQVSATVIGEDGSTILKNHIFRTLPESEGSGPEGQLSIDMSPVQPHTTTSKARTCDSCHLAEKALGYGIDGIDPNRAPDEGIIVDLMTADRQILPKSARFQIEPIAELTADWSRFVTEDGKQLQTVGSHFSRSRPLNNQERLHMSRRGVCLACHKEIPDQSLAASFLHHAAKHTGLLPKTPEQHNSLLYKILMITAWSQTALALGLPPLVTFCIVLWLVIRRRHRKRAGGL